MTLKILLTGKNQRIAANISEHLEADKGYKVVKCTPETYSLINTINDEMPHIAIICLGDEDRISIKVFNNIKECPAYQNMSTIVVAHSEDLKLFEAYTSLSRLHFLPRPVSPIALYNMLNEVESELISLGTLLQLDRDLAQVLESEKPKNTKKHILVVDDEPMQLSLMKENLSDFYDVTAVRSGEEALRFLENHSIDLMLLDYLMPEMDGPALLYQIRTTRAYLNLPVIFLTGVAERDKVVKTLTELRPQGYIIKPSKKSEIISKIIDVLG